MTGHVIHVTPLRGIHRYIMVHKTYIRLSYDLFPTHGKEQGQHIHVIVTGVSTIYFGRHEQIVISFTISAFGADKTGILITEIQWQMNRRILIAAWIICDRWRL